MVAAKCSTERHVQDSGRRFPRWPAGDTASAIRRSSRSSSPCSRGFTAPRDVVVTCIMRRSSRIRGSYQCIILSNGICNHSHVILDPAYLNGVGGDDDEDTTKTACHEAGHSVGLTHIDGGSDCMRNGELPFPDEIYYTFNPHHIAHINGAF